MELECLRNVIESSSNLAVLLGIKVSMDCGCLNYRQEDGLYDLEQKYGLSPEEMFSAGFYNTRPRQFFQFYQNELLAHPGQPDECLWALKKLEERGIVKSIITRELFSLAKRAGCRQVIELHGSIYENKCPRCQKSYGIQYMRKGTPVPLCESCNIPVRPQVSLMGELVDSRKIFQAASALEQADTLLILGCHFESILVSTCLPYFNGDQVILINEEEHFSDRKANWVFHGKPRDIMPLLVGDMAKAV